MGFQVTGAALALCSVLGFPALAQETCLNDPAGPFPIEARFENGTSLRVLNRFEDLMTYESTPPDGRPSVVTQNQGLIALQAQPKDADTVTYTYADEFPDLSDLSVGDVFDLKATWTQGERPPQDVVFGHTLLSIEDVMVGDCAFPTHLFMVRTTSDTGARLTLRFVHMPSSMTLQTLFSDGKGGWTHNKVVEVR